MVSAYDFLQQTKLATTQQSLQPPTPTQLRESATQTQQQGRLVQVTSGSGREGMLEALALRCGTPPPEQLHEADIEKFVAETYWLPTVGCSQNEANCWVTKVFAYTQAKMQAQTLAARLRELRYRKLVTEYQERGAVTRALCWEIAKMADATNIHPAFRYPLGEWDDSPAMPYNSEIAQGVWEVNGASYDMGASYRARLAAMEQTIAPIQAMKQLYDAPERLQERRLSELLAGAVQGGFAPANSVAALPVFPAMRGTAIKANYRFTAKYRDERLRWEPIIARSDAGQAPTGIPVQRFTHQDWGADIRELAGGTPDTSSIHQFFNWYWDTHRDADLVRSQEGPGRELTRGERRRQRWRKFGTFLLANGFPVAASPGGESSPASPILWLGPKHIEEIVLAWSDELTAPTYFDTALLTGWYNWVLNGFVMIESGIYPAGIEALEALQESMSNSVSAYGKALGTGSSAINGVFGIIVSIVYGAITALALGLGGIGIGHIDFIPPPNIRVPARADAGACALPGGAITEEVFNQIRNELLPVLGAMLGIPLAQLADTPVSSLFPPTRRAPPLSGSGFPWGWAMLGAGALALGGAFYLKRKK